MRKPKPTAIVTAANARDKAAQLERLLRRLSVEHPAEELVLNVHADVAAKLRERLAIWVEIWSMK